MDIDPMTTETTAPVHDTIALEPGEGRFGRADRERVAPVLRRGRRSGPGHPDAAMYIGPTTTETTAPIHDTIALEPGEGRFGRANRERVAPVLRRGRRPGPGHPNATMGIRP